MAGTRTTGWVLSLVAAGLSILTGCQTSRVQQERDALFAENREIQDVNVELHGRLERSQSTLDALRAERDRFANEARDQRMRLEGAHGGGAEPSPNLAGSVRTGFEGIRDVETEVTAGSMTIRIPGDVLFASGKANLKQAAKRTLDQIASVIQREYRTNIVRINGYTDKDPIRRSKWKDNLELSLQRAAAVHRFLQSKGIDPQRMYASGAGKWHPRATKAKSRRVELVVVLQE